METKTMIGDGGYALFVWNKKTDRSPFDTFY